MKVLMLALIIGGCQASLACKTIPLSLWNLTTVAAKEQGLETELLGALVWSESLYCEDVVSPKGALGLGQLMPATASELGVDPLDPGENLIGSARYLRAQIDTFGRLDHALAAYNAGPGAVKRWGGVPPYDETQSYVRAVLRHYQNFKVQTHARKEVERGLGVYHRPGR